MPESVGSPAALEAPAPFSFSIESLDRIAAPSREAFLRDYLRPRRPVILTGITESWLPLSEWALDRMVTRYGAVSVVAARLSEAIIHHDPRNGVKFSHVSLGEFVGSLTDSGPASHYVMAPTSNFPKDLHDAYRAPAYCDSAPHLRSKVWIGKQGTVSPLHRDVPHNLHVQLSGRKRWLLFSPRQNARLYPRPVLSGAPNFSQVDPEHPDYDRYPRFRAATAMAATLSAGEALFIPQGWWHHVRSLDHTVSMNFWWGGRLIELAARASTMFKRVRGIAQNEWA